MACTSAPCLPRLAELGRTTLPTRYMYERIQHGRLCTALMPLEDTDLLTHARRWQRWDISQSDRARRKHSAMPPPIIPATHYTITLAIQWARSCDT